VNDLSFTAYPGEIFGLLGPNGAGKTTCLRAISTLIKPDSGDIFVGETSVVTDPESVRGKIGFLTSELKLEDHFTPNYLYIYFSRLHGIEDEVIEERKDAFFERFGIAEFREVKVGDLSTGMKQKVSIAISLVHNPDYIIFDEPTNGLDVLTARSVMDYLIELKEAGKTVILSTHILSVVDKLCDRVGIIINGKMKLCDTLENVLKTDPNNNLEEIFFELVKEDELLGGAY
ncbi:MAG: ABC transporter ATP-binding protein, partial [Candidatus Izimaplasma sp.]|nr:ABC transporter ATP-binding protein [Candidatus Izimaplasma bacterium]